jgi:hypothetical protein
LKKRLRVVGLPVAAVLLTGCVAAGVVTVMKPGTPPPVSEQVQKYYDENVKNKTAGPVAVQSKAVPVHLISDSHAHNAGSWWRQTIGAGAIEGATMGSAQSFPGADSEAITSQLKAVDY